jgi:hypothetical protein
MWHDNLHNGDDDDDDDSMCFLFVCFSYLMLV